MSVPLTKPTVNARLLVGGMERLAQMTITVTLGARRGGTVRAATTVNDRLVDDRTTTMAVETMDAAPRRETHMDRRRRRDENRTATTLTTEGHRHHPGATVPIHTLETVTRMVVDPGLHPERVMAAAMQRSMREDDIGEFPASIYDSALMASIESHFLRLIRIDRVRRGNIVAERSPSYHRSVWCRMALSYRM